MNAHGRDALWVPLELVDAVADARQAAAFGPRLGQAEEVPSQGEAHVHCVAQVEHGHSEEVAGHALLANPWATHLCRA